MSLEHDGAKLDQHQKAAPPSITAEAPHDSCELSEAELQERNRKEYIEQLKRMSCPGCGGDGLLA